MMLENLAPNSNVPDVEIAYSEQEVLDKLQTYKLSTQLLNTKLAVNLNQLTQIKISEHIQTDSFLFMLCEALKNWQNADSYRLTAQLNELIFLWLNAIQDGTSTHTISNFLRCFEIKSSLGFSRISASNSSNFHLFLFDLLTETLHEHQILAAEYLLNFDANTNLPNSNQILSHLDFALKNTAAGQTVGLLSLHFQAARNKLNFSKRVALTLNKQIANTLTQNIPPNYQLYFSGDSQFDILIPNLTGQIQLSLFAAKLSRAFEQMLLLNNQSILVTPFIGSAMVDENTQSANDLYTNVKLALESAIAKQQELTPYSDELKQQLTEQNTIESKVLEAFGSDNLTLFFQPIVNLKNGKCAGAELLLRWSEKFGYSVYPSLTIEILNKVGKGKLFTRWLINSACRYASELIQVHKLAIYLTINLRAEDLYDIELPHLLTQAIELWKLKPQDIILEITENGILEYNESSNSVISQLADNGFKFALDDFGTGFSSLSRLRTMPIDLIKIDQSFVRNITESKEDFEIVQSIALLSKSLGKEVLVEGVEDEASLNMIKRLDIDKCQGYYFARPMPYEQFIDWAKAH